MIEIIYIQHKAGTFEDGLQVCVYCGKVICDYTGQWIQHSVDLNGNKIIPGAIQGWPEGEIYITGSNPVQTISVRPMENYGKDDPYTRKIIKCVK